MSIHCRQHRLINIGSTPVQGPQHIEHTIVPMQQNRDLQEDEGMHD